MTLRCVIKKTGNGYVGGCLELSLAIKGRTSCECEKKLEQTINNYIETVNKLGQKGSSVTLRPVRFYYFKRSLFDLKMYLSQIAKRDISNTEYTQNKLVLV